MKQKKQYPYLILILCFLIQGGILGVISNCRGLVYTPVCAQLGISLGAFTAYSTFYGAALCLSIPLATKLVRQGNLRVILTASSLLIAAAQYAMSWFTQPWQWYLAASIQGICHAVLFIQTVPMLINNWFATRKGFFLGLACSASGLVGAVMNRVTERYMALNGWQASYRMLGLVLFFLLVPACAAFSIRRPEDVGAKPYGAENPRSPSAPSPAAFQNFRNKTAVFGFLIGYACLVCLTVGYNQILFSLGLTFNHPREQASIFVSLAMIGTIIFKLLVGWLNDRFGSAWACRISGGAIIAGLIFLTLGRDAKFMLAGSFLMGMPMAVSIVVAPNLVRDVFGSGEFESRYKFLSIAVNLSSNFSYTLIGWIISATSYSTALATGIFTTAASLIFLTAAFIIRKRSFVHE